MLNETNHDCKSRGSEQMPTSRRIQRLGLGGRGLSRRAILSNLMGDYYSDKLSAERLRRCYDVAPPRVKQYLDAEIGHVTGRIRAHDAVLELGCGYGRVMKDLACRAGLVVGIDTSLASLHMARSYLSGRRSCRLAQMNAAALGFGDHAFDVVACIQNGLSAFKVNQRDLVRECTRVTRPGGTVLLSSYAERFWPDRLDWFRRQSEHGLLGEIDWDRTRDGVIVCKDGFMATTIRPADFRTLTAGLGVPVALEEVDESSLFCEITVPESSIHPRHGGGRE